MAALILIIVGALLIYFNRKEFPKKENFLETFNNASKNITDKDLDMLKLRKEFAETIVELQHDIEAIKDKISNDNVENIPDDILTFESEEVNIKEEQKVIVEDKNNENELGINNIKISEVDRLKKEGLSVEQICEKLGIGKGEVLLIEKLYLE